MSSTTIVRTLKHKDNLVKKDVFFSKPLWLIFLETGATLENLPFPESF